MTEQTTTPGSEPTAAPTPGTPEYDAAMAARYRESKGLPPEPGNEIARAAAASVERPAHIPEKFWDAATGAVNTEALLASYAALERTQGSRAPTPAPTPPAVPGDQSEASSTAADRAQEAVQKAGLDWNVLAAKATRGEKFTDAEYAALEGAGMPRAVAETVATALVERQTAEHAAAIEYAGGQAETDKLLGWAAANLSEAEKATINQQLASPMWRLAVDAVRARMAAAKPTAGEPTLHMGGNQPPSTTGYRSRAEMKADMASPGYKSDPAFREKVALKMRFASWDLD